MSSNRLLIYLGVAAVLVIIFIVIAKKQGWIGKGHFLKVSIAAVEKRTVMETVSASGKIHPQMEVKISPDVSGEIIELNVMEGDSVMKGFIMAKINPDIYVAAVDRMEAVVNTQKANYATSQARLIMFRASYDQVNAEYIRSKKLFDKKVISASEFEAITAQHRSAKAEMDAAVQSVNASLFNVKSAEASLKEARDQLEKTTIMAPVSGIISKLSVEIGERVVGTSQMAGTEMMRIANLNDMEVQVDVSENDIIRVSIGDTVIIEVDAYLDREFTGLVSEIASSANLESQISSDQVTNFKVKISLLRSSYIDLIDSLDNKKYPFYPGMSASVEIQTNIKIDVLTIDIQAITLRNIEGKEDDKTEKQRKGRKEKSKDEKKDDTDPKSGEKKTEVVFIYEKNTVSAIEVKTGIQDETYIVINEGLEEGDEVVVAPYSAISKKLEDGDSVEKVDKDKLFGKSKK